MAMSCLNVRGVFGNIFLRISEITCTSRSPGFSMKISYFKFIFSWCVGEICRGTFPQGEYINQQRTGRILLRGLCPKPLGLRSVFSECITASWKTVQPWLVL